MGVLRAEFPKISGLTAERALSAPLGAVSPLWFAYGAAATAGLAYWWMTHWLRPTNLEAVAVAPTTPEPEPVIEAPPALALAPEPESEPLVEAAPVVAPEPVTEAPAPIAAAPPEPVAEIKLAEPAPPAAAETPTASPPTKPKAALKSKPVAKPAAVSAPTARAPRRKPRPAASKAE